MIYFTIFFYYFWFIIIGYNYHFYFYFNEILTKSQYTWNIFVIYLYFHTAQQYWKILVNTISLYILFNHDTQILLDIVNIFDHNKISYEGRSNYMQIIFRSDDII